MTTTHVIILAQGTQQRLVGVDTPKQLLRLPACGGATILGRTCHLVKDHGEVTVVTWETVSNYLHFGEAGGITSVLAHQLEDPGNSSLKGIARYLAEMHGNQWPHPEPLPDQFVVLLGDVVYSWDSLLTLLVERNRPIFSVSSDLGPSSGELWGIAWPRAWHPSMMRALQDALANHPPARFDDTYQPGQLRHWLWMLQKTTADIHCPTLPGDYIMDVDLPEHIKLLPDVSVRARADDLDHGVTW